MIEKLIFFYLQRGKHPKVWMADVWSVNKIWNLFYAALICWQSTIGALVTQAKGWKWVLGWFRLLSFCLFVFLSFCLFVFLSFCLFVFLSFCQNQEKTNLRRFRWGIKDKIDLHNENSVTSIRGAFVLYRRQGVWWYSWIVPPNPPLEIVTLNLQLSDALFHMCICI